MSGLNAFPDDQPSTSQDESIAVSEFEEVFRDQYKVMVSYVVRRGVPATDADTVVNNAFLGLWKFWKQRGRPHNPASLLQLVVKRRLIDYVREEHHHAKFAISLGQEAMTKAVSTEDSSRSLEVAEQLGELLALLPHRQREVLTLRMDGLSENEIGARLGIEPKTVSAHLFRARRTAREFLGVR
ncbi:RNA polymerase sigma factor [Streptomyces sp. NBC_00989]|uniref:RNA polymerase sigma factor n=1 Tax=Streptomyces sp. NBC_00989 TaxID=2903705 RepID=UPI003870232C|nr:sigma-70 family RNA polymerase sigma factor [Streptomyces sp. NBC_00989]